MCVCLLLLFFYHSWTRTPLSVWQEAVVSDKQPFISTQDSPPTPLDHHSSVNTAAWRTLITYQLHDTFTVFTDGHVSTRVPAYKTNNIQLSLIKLNNHHYIFHNFTTFLKGLYRANNRQTDSTWCVYTIQMRPTTTGRGQTSTKAELFVLYYLLNNCQEYWWKKNLTMLKNHFLKNPGSGIWFGLMPKSKSIVPLSRLQSKISQGLQSHCWFYL